MFYARCICSFTNNSIDIFILGMKGIKTYFIGNNEKNQNARSDPNRKPKNIEQGIGLRSGEITKGGNEVVPDHTIIFVGFIPKLYQNLK